MDEERIAEMDTQTRTDVELVINMLRFLDVNGRSFTVPQLLVLMVLQFEYGTAGTDDDIVRACRGGVPKPMVERHEARAKRAICAGVSLGRIGVTTFGRVGLRELGGELPCTRPRSGRVH